MVPCWSERASRSADTTTARRFSELVVHLECFTPLKPGQPPSAHRLHDDARSARARETTHQRDPAPDPGIDGHIRARHYDDVCIAAAPSRGCRTNRGGCTKVTTAHFANLVGAPQPGEADSPQAKDLIAKSGTSLSVNVR